MIYDIPDLPGYHASADGRIFSSKSGALRELRGSNSGKGYRLIFLYVAGRRFVRTVHQLIAATFLPLRTAEYNELRHLDGNPKNNAVSNLAWGTRSENRLDAIRHGTFPVGERSGFAKLMNAQVREIRDRLARGERPMDVAPIYGVTRTNIIHIRRGATWKYVA